MRLDFLVCFGGNVAAVDGLTLALTRCLTSWNSKHVLGPGKMLRADIVKMQQVGVVHTLGGRLMVFNLNVSGWVIRHAKDKKIMG